MMAAAFRIRCTSLMQYYASGVVRVKVLSVPGIRTTGLRFRSSPQGSGIRQAAVGAIMLPMATRATLKAINDELLRRGHNAARGEGERLLLLLRREANRSLPARPRPS